MTRFSLWLLAAIAALAIGCQKQPLPPSQKCFDETVISETPVGNIATRSATIEWALNGDDLQEVTSTVKDAFESPFSQGLLQYGINGSFAPNGSSVFFENDEHPMVVLLATRDSTGQVQVTGIRAIQTSETGFTGAWGTGVDGNRFGFTETQTEYIFSANNLTPPSSSDYSQDDRMCLRVTVKK